MSKNGKTLKSTALASLLIIYARRKSLPLLLTKAIYFVFDNFPNLSIFCQANTTVKAVVYPISFHQCKNSLLSFRRGLGFVVSLW